MKYRFQGKEKLISLGRYPAVSLKEAREKAMEARKTLETGSDPSAERKLKKQAAGNTFELVAREWHELQSSKWTDKYSARVMNLLTRNLFPFIGSRPIAEITAPEILALLRKVEARGVIGTAHALKYACSNIMRYAIATGRAERDPAADLRGALKPHIKKHRPALTNPEQGMGFEKEEMCPHGFRVMASTLLNELGYNRDWIERQLAHVPTEQVRGIYNRAEYLPERRKMLQAWADYLDELRNKARTAIESEYEAQETATPRTAKHKKDTAVL